MSARQHRGYLSQARSRLARHGPKAEVVELRSLEQLRRAFNDDTGTPRLVFLFSPTCPVCHSGARWARTEILDRYPSARLKVLAVWFNAVPGDSRRLLDTRVLSDSRVTYFWDQQKVAGRWFSEHVTNRRRITWDAYFLYGPGARWDQEPGPLVSRSPAGSVIAAASQLQQAVQPFLEG
jgi:hypothetical protein